MARPAAAARVIAEGSEDDAYLGVASSARGLRWRERLGPTARNTALAISQQHDLPELLGRVLAARGVTVDEVETVLAPTLRALMPDPATLRDMDRAAGRLADAVVAREPVAVFGDYDVDGACSAALLARFLAHHGVASRIYIPDRLFEGYGPSETAIRQLIAEGAGLIVTVDCGTTSFAPLKAAAELGVDVVVIDHHQADATLPEAYAVVNPNRQDDLSGLGHLCAAGVTFLVLVATARELRRRGHYQSLAEPSLLGLTDLVALATVADVVALRTLNRAYVTAGLKVMRQRQNIGLKALLEVAGIAEAPTPYMLGYVLGPRINAGGRIGDAALGARLLTTADEMEAARIAALLDKLNRERRAIETATLEAAQAEAEARLAGAAPPGVLVIGSGDWHKGIIGLVASRLTERFQRPTCVISWDGAAGQGTGSLRSVAGVDIGAAVRRAVADGLLVKGGGHAMAAGLTIARDRLPDLERFLEGALGSAASDARRQTALDIDGALTAAGANDDLIGLLERAGPYGQGNPQPRFAFPSHRVRFAKVVGEAHVRCVLEAGDGSRLDAVAFRAAGQPVGNTLIENGGRPLHLAGALRRDSWGGRERIELLIDDAAEARRG